MKTILLIAILLVMNIFTSLAQDVIVKKSGEVLNVYNVDVASKYIFYTTEQASDDIKRIHKEEVFSVKIGDSEMQMIGEVVKEKKQLQENTVKSDEKIEGLVERKVNNNNAELIARYNKRHDGFTDKKPTDKVEEHGWAILGITKESVLSNEDIEVELRIIKDKYGDYYGFGGAIYGYCSFFNVFIWNKTNRTVYVDLGNTFKIYNSGNTKAYYDGSQRILAIPPLGKVCLPPHYEIDGKKIIKFYDNIEICYPQKTKGVMKKFAVTDFTENETLWKNQFMITYSTDLSFKTYSILKFSLYLRQLIGGRIAKSWDYKKCTQKIHLFDEYTLIGPFCMHKKIQDVLDVKPDKNAEEIVFY